MDTTTKNLLIAIKSVEGRQAAAKNPSLWQSYEDELIDLRERLKNGTAK
jgi:hypothetical protein